ncbi:putative zinc finger protein [Tripterygium wilfordii]|uniref:Putative zinc finger protein n=1 Tax=Tripterygium wilfordii TaxID=458696 RepID=A0A7J7CL61_TRIWF|nr:E3 ubiquitin-protein ligase RHA1B-like [Tripterygium wilfordii]KAF5734802.1 putative zinc finger protein [Tripterygium wilfordii]
MGFPVGYTELLLPKALIHTLSILGFIRKLINTLFRYLGLPDFSEPDFVWTDQQPTRIPVSPSMSTLLIREILPVVKFSDLVDPPDSCAVCLYEFESDDEIRRLTNCRHIFHRICLDRWMGYDQKTCPLCRTPFLPDHQQEDFNERLWGSSGISESFGEYSQIPGLYQDISY